MKISNLRREYNLKTLNEEDAHSDAMMQFEQWWNDALEEKISDINAMTLSTYDIKNKCPNARIVLLKDFSLEGFSFFTNYESQKGQELERHNIACILFFWKELERQIKITGHVKKLAPKTSTEYFVQRPLNSQLATWASKQSSKVDNREELENNFKQAESKYGSHVPCPAYWGGYILNPQTIEYWQGRASRLHDRLVYERKEKNWVRYRLAP